jgi:hypothetical protein
MNRDKQGRYATCATVRGEFLEDWAAPAILIIICLTAILAVCMGQVHLNRGEMPIHENPEAAGRLSQSGEIDKGQRPPPALSSGVESRHAELYPHSEPDLRAKLSVPSRTSARPAQFNSPINPGPGVGQWSENDWDRGILR